MEDEKYSTPTLNTENSLQSDQMESKEAAPPLMALNHVSRLCKSVESSTDFYEKVLGFVLIKRPEAFNFDGAWLFNYGIGIHLVHKKDGLEDHEASKDRLDPMDNHISFQCEDMEAMEKKLKEKDITYKKRVVDAENGSQIDQLFFNDPDGFMIEICNCENLELVPDGSIQRIKMPVDRHNPPVALNDIGSVNSNANLDGM